MLIPRETSKQNMWTKIHVHFVENHQESYSRHTSDLIYEYVLFYKGQS